jgi:hypothetical protein
MVRERRNKRIRESGSAVTGAVDALFGSNGALLLWAKRRRGRLAAEKARTLLTDCTLNAENEAFLTNLNKKDAGRCMSNNQ